MISRIDIMYENFKQTEDFDILLNNLLSFKKLIEMSVPKVILDNLDIYKNRNSISFKKTVDLCKRLYLHELSRLEKTIKQYSFLQFAKDSFKVAQQSKKRYDKLPKEQQDNFWKLIEEIDKQIKS